MLAQGARAALGLRAWRETAPLGLSTLWHASPPRTSQRAAARAMLAPGLAVGVVTGGNRSGKSELGAMLLAAWALGAEDEGVARWLRRNGLADLADTLPKPPTTCCAVALSSHDSRRVQRPKLAACLPAATVWRNRDGNGEAWATLPNGSEIVFKMNEQGQRAYQGDAWDLVWFDEEPDEPVWNEARMRLPDRRGRAILTMTPIRGMTWVWKRYVDQVEPGSVVVPLHSRDNPHVPQDYLEALLRTYGAHERAARERGDFATLEGRVYDFRRDLHVVAAHAAPATWPRYGAIDFGTRNPFAYLLLALDQRDDVLHVLAEHYQAERTLRQHAEAMRSLHADVGLVPWRGGRADLAWTVADPADAGARLSLSTEEGIVTEAGEKDVRIGINAVAERLAPDAAGRPHLVVHDRCRNLIREFESYVWHPEHGRADAHDAPLKRDDHALDALRYACMRLRRPEPEIRIGWLT